jgi:3-isopropylmalate/(R)-2-methylmalate dehydratase small subunit
LLTVVIDQADIEAIWVAVEADPKTQIKVDLEAKTVSYGGESIAFAIDDYTRWRLMEGLDDIGLTLKNIDSVSSFEQSRPSYKPKTLPALS